MSWTFADEETEAQLGNAICLRSCGQCEAESGFKNQFPLTPKLLLYPFHPTACPSGQKLMIHTLWRMGPKAPSVVPSLLAVGVVCPTVAFA